MNTHALKIVLAVLGSLAILQIALYRNPIRTNPSTIPADLSANLAQLIMNNSSIRLGQNIFNTQYNISTDMQRIARLFDSVPEEKRMKLYTELQGELSKDWANHEIQSVDYSRTTQSLSTFTLVMLPITNDLRTEIRGDKLLSDDTAPYSPNNLKHWQPDWWNKTDLYEVLTERRQLITER